MLLGTSGFEKKAQGTIEYGWEYTGISQWEKKKWVSSEDTTFGQVTSCLQTKKQWGCRSENETVVLQEAEECWIYSPEHVPTRGEEFFTKMAKMVREGL